MDDELKARFSERAAAPSAPIDPTAIRRMARQRRSRRLVAGSGLAAICLLGGLIAWGGPERSEAPVQVLTPPPSSSVTTTTKFEPSLVPGTTGTVERAVDWDAAPGPCAEPGGYALRADLAGDGTEAYILDVEDPSSEADEVPARLLRVCDDDQVWDFQVGYVQLMSTVRVGDRWFVAWGGTSASARYQTLLTLVDGHLIEVLDDQGAPVRLIEGNVADEPPQIRDWWGCEADSLVAATREAGSSEWHLTRYRWDDNADHMVIHTVETRAAAPGPGATTTYGEGIEHLADVLPAACAGSDSWGPGGVPRWITENREPRWLG